jgi:Pyrimidine reductase, riboflavin biosynthesis
LVYTNFISSLDGRIALINPHSRIKEVPEPIKNPRDWRLYQELGAQADILITSGKYVRAIAQGRVQECVRIGGDPENADLLAWRQAQGLSAHPAVAVISATLNIPLPASLLALEQPVYVIVGEQHRQDRGNIARLEKQGIQVIFAGQGDTVEGKRLVHALGERGFKSLYSIAGPQILHMLLQDRVLQRLYITLTHQILGSTNFSSLVRGPVLQPSLKLTLVSLYYDASIPHEAGQFFTLFQQDIAS